MISTINTITGILLVLLGFMIIKYKMTYLIAGYNTSSKKEQEKYDKDKLVNSVGKLLIILGTIIILGAILSLIFETISKQIILASWIIFAIYAVVWIFYINFSKCLMKNNKREISSK